jgi:integrase
MAHIQDRRDKRKGWVVRYRDHSKRERSKSFARRVDAERFAAQVEIDKLTGAWTDPARGKITVAEWADEWLATKVDLRASTRFRLEGVVRNHVLTEFASTSLERVTNGVVRAWIAKLSSKGTGPSTIRKAYNALAQMMRAAVSDRRIATDPCRNVPLPQEHQLEQRFLSATQVEALADAIESRFRCLVLLAAYGGLRWGELAGLRRKRIDLLRGRVVIEETLVEVGGDLTFGQPKTKRSRRTIPLPRRVVSELEAHLHKFTDPAPGAVVFTGPKGALLRRAGFARSWWKPATQSVGLNGLKFHELRHTFVALWIAAGANPKEVSIRAGHSSVAFTLDRYGHLYEDREDDVPDRLDQLLTFPSAGPMRDQKEGNGKVNPAIPHLTSTFGEWPQRDLNPCYRLERAAS